MSLITKLRNNPIALIGSIWILSDFGYYLLLPRLATIAPSGYYCPVWELPQTIMKTAWRLRFIIFIGLGSAWSFSHRFILHGKSDHDGAHLTTG